MKLFIFLIASSALQFLARAELPALKVAPKILTKKTHCQNFDSAISSRGGSAITKDRDSPSISRSFYVGSFLFILSLSLVSLYPAPYLVGILGAEKATRLLASVVSTGALTEIAVSPLIGALVDAAGRKPIMIATVLVIATNHATVSALAARAISMSASDPTAHLASASGRSDTQLIVPISLGKYFASIVVGIFFLSSGAMMADVHRDDPKALASANGVLFSLVNAGFGVGVSLSGMLPQGLAWPYAVSAAAALAGAVCLASGVKETLQPHERKRVSRTAVVARLLNPFSFTRLLARGRRLRLLTIALVLQSAPIFMGEVLQVFVVSEWHLPKPQVVQLFSALALTGVVANAAAASGAISILGGLRPFTLVATLSSALLWAGLVVGKGYQTALVCAVVGFLGQARGLGVSTLLQSEGGRAGLGQGEVSGDRANLFGWLKVIGPLLYQQLYVSGKTRSFAQLPFAFNIALTVAALVMSHIALAPSAPPRDGQ